MFKTHPGIQVLPVQLMVIRLARNVMVTRRRGVRRRKVIIGLIRTGSGGSHSDIEISTGCEENKRKGLLNLKLKTEWCVMALNMVSWRGLNTASTLGTMIVDLCDLRSKTDSDEAVSMCLPPSLM
jgi:hypothetical protein